MSLKNHGSVGIDAEKLMFIVYSVLEYYDIEVEEPKFDFVGILKPDVAKLTKTIRENCDSFKNLSIPLENGQITTDGRQMVTSRFVNGDYIVEKVIAHIVESGQFAQIFDEVMDARPKEDPKDVQKAISYALYIVAKGWVAERQLNNLSERYDKMWETHDLAGIDFQDLQKSTPKVPAYVQLRSFLYGHYSGNTSGTDSKGNKLLFWAWIGGDLWTCDDSKELEKRIQKEYGVGIRDIQRNYEHFSEPGTEL